MIIVMNLGKNRRPECEITLINTLTLVKLPSKSKEHIVFGLKQSPLPIIVKLSHYKASLDLLQKKAENIVNQAPDNRTNEEDVWKTIRISEDFPARVIRVRYKLYPFLKSSIEEGRHSYLKNNRLMVDDQEYTYDYYNARPALARK